MLRARYFFNALIFMSCAALTACGGGGGGGGGSSGGGSSITDAPNSYFPTDTGSQWTYSISTGGNTTLHFSDDSVVKIAGVRTQVHALTYPITGAKEYYVTANDKISLQGLYIPTILVGGSSYSADGRFTDLVDILNTTAGAATGTRAVNGAGKVKISGYDSRSLTYTGTVNYVGEENVTTGTGPVTARHTIVNLSMTTKVDGATFNIGYLAEYWIADTLGIVKRIESSVTYTLQSKT